MSELFDKCLEYYLRPLDTLDAWHFCETVIIQTCSLKSDTLDQFLRSNFHHIWISLLSEISQVLKGLLDFREKQIVN